MSLIQLLVVVLVFGLIYWLVMQLPLPAPFKMIAQVILIVIAIIWLLSAVGLLPGRLTLGARTFDTAYAFRGGLHLGEVRAAPDSAPTPPTIGVVVATTPIDGVSTLERQVPDAVLG